MGYDVHITRAKDWLNAKKKPISLGSWLDYVKDDADMQLEAVAIGRVNGVPAIQYRNEGLAVWLGFSGHDPNGNKAWFDYRDGRIVVKNPSEEILGKMKEIAAYFKAFVVGDDGEHY